MAETNVTEVAADDAAAPQHGRRMVALLGGTTTAADCGLALRYLLDLRHLVKGPAITEFERAFAAEIGVRHALSFATGRVALYGLLRSLGIGAGDDVMFQVPTHVVVANAIRYTGARPVYVDCERETYNLDLADAKRRVTPQTKALVLQHTFGMPADLDAVVSFTEAQGLVLIEDCVHSLGATYGGRAVGSFGRAAIFSTEETKTLTTTMGGMVVTDDSALATSLRRFQDGCSWPALSLTARYVTKLIAYHLLTDPWVYGYTRALYLWLGRRQPFPGATTEEERRGLPTDNLEQRLSNAQAALGLRQLRRLGANVEHRRSIAAKCEQELSRHGFDMLPAPPKADPALIRYPVRVSNRDRAVRAAARHVVLGTWFTSVLEESVSPAVGDYRQGSCPRAEEAVKQLINLPTHPRITRRDVKVIIEALAAAEDDARPSGGDAPT